MKNKETRALIVQLLEACKFANANLACPDGDNETCGAFEYLQDAIRAAEDAGFMAENETFIPEEFKCPEPKWYLYPFGSKDVTFSLTERPCWWNRIWMRVFFGWVFEPIKKSGE